MKDIKHMPTRDLVKKYKLNPKDKILDMGGSSKQLEGVSVHTLVDLVHPEVDPYWPQKLTAKNFVQLDITRDHLPFPDNFFDFCYCSHTLEDLIDPRLILKEMERVAKRGVIFTPSRGQDMAFTRFDMTDWNTGGRRVPGHAHHYWFFETSGNQLLITPKNYPLLYSDEFQYVSWSGPLEMEFYWTETINYEVWVSTSFHQLIENYREFVKKNRKLLKKQRVLLWLGNPFIFLKEITKKYLGRINPFAKNP